MTTATPTAQSETGRLARVVLKHAREAFRSAEDIAGEWQPLNFTSAPDFDRAIAEYEAFAGVLRDHGAQVEFLPRTRDLTLDSIYVRDASVVCDRGVIICRMGKTARGGEPAAQEAALRAIGLPILGTIQPPGALEGGDVVWLGPRTIAVGRGYRTNDDGIRQLRALLGDGVDEVIVVPLPHWRGPGDVFHLMSIISPVDRDLAVVYAPLLPVPFRERLLDLGMSLVEVPDEEFDSMGANVLAIAPRRCLMVAGNPRTRARLESAGAEVIEYEGREISARGGGGPTCLTRPLVRSAQ
ncbi:MAG TPA: arginine deiminase family protein [Vicinamibacterales bacterium]|nr:arginine deiminase family protein [Vicinamibacterales bacterium]